MVEYSLIKLELNVNLIDSQLKTLLPLNISLDILLKYNKSTHNQVVLDHSVLVAY